MNVLVGDIGGTKTALGVYARTGAADYEILAENTYPSQEHASLSDVLRLFLPTLGGHVQIDRAVFSVAGPVVDGEVSTTNLPWKIAERDLSAHLGAKVALINDFHAVVLGVRELPPSALYCVQKGDPKPRAAYAVLGAGTGLGEGIGIPLDDGSVRVLASEGGHVDFAARTEVEVKLWHYLRAQHERVSVERVVSGLGLETLYEFVVASGLAPADPETLRRFEHESHGAVIADRMHVDPASAQVMALFVSAYGAEAGNLALKVLPAGGLYVAGGIAARSIEQLDWAEFTRSFSDKGRMKSLLTSIPIYVVRDLKVGLLGARAYAALL